MNFSIQGKTQNCKYVMTSLEQLELDRQFYSFNTRNRIFDFKIVQHFMKKISVWAYVTYFFVVSTCNDFFVFFLTFSIWKLNLHAVYVRFHLQGTLKLLNCLYIYISTTAAKRVRKYQKSIMAKLYYTAKS